jgi:hypothetical protein
VLAPLQWDSEPPQLGGKQTPNLAARLPIKGEAAEVALYLQTAGPVGAAIVAGIGRLRRNRLMVTSGPLQIRCEHRSSRQGAD